MSRCSCFIAVITASPLFWRLKSSLIATRFLRKTLYTTLISDFSALLMDQGVSQSTYFIWILNFFTGARMQKKFMRSCDSNSQRWKIIVIVISLETRNEWKLKIALILRWVSFVKTSICNLWECMRRLRWITGESSLETWKPSKGGILSHKRSLE